jgi:hypothetical protein
LKKGVVIEMLKGRYHGGANSGGKDRRRRGQGKKIRS